MQKKYNKVATIAVKKVIFHKRSRNSLFLMPFVYERRKGMIIIITRKTNKRVLSIALCVAMLISAFGGLSASALGVTITSPSGIDSMTVTDHVFYDDFEPDPLNGTAASAANWETVPGNSHSNNVPASDHLDEPHVFLTSGGKGVLRSAVDYNVNNYSKITTINDTAWSAAKNGNRKVLKVEAVVCPAIDPYWGQTSSVMAYKIGMTESLALEISKGGTAGSETIWARWRYFRTPTTAELNAVPISTRIQNGVYSDTYGSNIDTNKPLGTWIKVILSYDYSQISANTLTVSAKIVLASDSSETPICTINNYTRTFPTTGTGTYDPNWKPGIGSSLNPVRANSALYDSFKVTFESSIAGTFEADEFDNPALSKQVWATEVGNRFADLAPTIRTAGGQGNYKVGTYGSVGGTRSSMQPAAAAPASNTTSSLKHNALITTIKDEYWDTSKRISTLESTFLVETITTDPGSSVSIYAYHISGAPNANIHGGVGNVFESLSLQFYQYTDTTDGGQIKLGIRWHELYPDRTVGSVSNDTKNLATGDYKPTGVGVGFLLNRWTKVVFTYDYTNISNGKLTVSAVITQLQANGTTTSLTRTCTSDFARTADCFYADGWKVGFGSTNDNADNGNNRTYFDNFKITFEQPAAVASYTVSIPSGNAAIKGNVTQIGSISADITSLGASPTASLTVAASTNGVLARTGDAQTTLPYTLCKDGAGLLPFTSRVYTAADVTTPPAPIPLYVVVDEVEWLQAKVGIYEGLINFSITYTP